MAKTAKHREMDMLHGGLAGRLILFALPLGGLLYGGDPYLLLADFDDYAATHERLYAAIADPATRARLSLVNIARSGIFAADRAVREYAERIWEVQV